MVAKNAILFQIFATIVHILLIKLKIWAGIMRHIENCLSPFLPHWARNDGKHWFINIVWSHEYNVDLLSYAQTCK